MKKKKLVLHVGPLKTGSTSIQRFLKDNSADLKKNKIYYFERSWAWADYFVSSFFIVRRRRQDRWLNLAHLLDDICNQIKNAANDFDVYIASSEYLGMMNIPEVEYLISFMKQFFENVTIVMFYRNPITLATSLKQQFCRRGFWGLNDQIPKKFVQYSLLYDHLSNKLSHDFVLLKFEDAINYGGVINYFLEKCHINFPSGDYTSYHENRSVSFEAVIIASVMRDILLEDNDDCFKYKAEIEKVVMDIDGTKFILNTADQHDVINHSKCDIAWLSNYLGYNPYPELNSTDAQNNLLWNENSIKSLANVILNFTNVKK